MTFEAFVIALDALVRGRVPGAGLFHGPHVAYWQRGDETARVREGERGDVELTLAGDDADEVLYGASDQATVERFADAIVRTVRPRS